MMYSNNIEILTPDGFMPFSGVNKSISKKTLTIDFLDGGNITVTRNHVFINNGVELLAADLKVLDIISDRTIVKIKNNRKSIDVYDALNVGGGHVYLTNNIPSHNCVFAGSAFTLGDGSKVAALPIATGQPLFHNYMQYESPKANNAYVMTVDTSRGADLDYSAFLVIDITQLPYKVVATFRDNTINTMVYPDVIIKVAQQFNDAFVLIECNDLGQQVGDILLYDLEYENVYMSVKDTIKEGGGSKKIPGLRTTKKSKSIGCNQLKTIVEGDNIEINDAELISELSTFVRKGASYAADEGKHDDLVMCLVLFGYLTQTSVFKELFDFSLRGQLVKRQLAELDEQMAPIGFVTRGGEDDDVIVYPTKSGFQEPAGMFDWSSF